MGQYLSVGIAQSIYIKKANITKEDIYNMPINNFNLNIYNMEEDEEYIILKLKDDIIENNLVNLLNELKLKSKETEKTYYEQAILELNKKNNKEIMQLAKNKSIRKFQYLEGCKLTNDISYLFDQNIRAFCDHIAIEFDGKIFFECYNNIFAFLRNSIIESLDNILKYSLVVTIMG